MKIANIVTICVSLLLLGEFAWSAPIKPEDEIRFRQSGYMFMRWNMGRIKQQVIKNPLSYNESQVTAAADVIAAIANSGIIALFSDASKTGKGWKETRVKPEFFEQPEKVQELADTLAKEAATLATAAHTGDVNQIREQFDVLLKACKACHKKFRSKE